jgi:hypothetical protein
MSGHAENQPNPKKSVHTVKIYSLPGDGSIRYWNNTNFITARQSNSGGNNTTTGVNINPISEGAINWNDGKNWINSRIFLPFDTSSIPLNATITAATLNLSGRKYVKGGFISLVLSTQENPNTLKDSDYGKITFIRQAADKNTDNFSVNTTMQPWKLNKTGLNNIRKGEITQFAVITQNDFGNRSPISKIDNNFGITDVGTSRAQDEKKPFLEITYTIYNDSTNTPPEPVKITPVEFKNPEGSATFNQPYQNLSFPIPKNGQFFYSLGDSLKSALFYRQGVQILNFDFQERGRKIVEQKLSEINLNENSSYPLRIPNPNGSGYIDSPQFSAFSSTGFYTLGINNSNNTFIPSVGGEQKKQLGKTYFQTQTKINPDSITITYNLADVLSVPIFSLNNDPANFVNFQPLPAVAGETAEIITRTISPVNPQGTDIVSNVYGTYFKSPSLTETLIAAGATPAQILALLQTPSTAMSREQLGNVLGIYYKYVSPYPVSTNENIPKIIKFFSNKVNIKVGEPVVLTWEVANADFVTITNWGGILANAGQITLYPTNTTTYKLVINNAPEITASITINVDTNPAVGTLNNPLLNKIYLTTFNYDINGQSTPKVILPGTPSTLTMLKNLTGSFVKEVKTQIVSDAQVCLENGGVQECLATCGIAMDATTLATLGLSGTGLGTVIPATTAVIGGLCDFSNGLIYFAQGEFLQGAVQMVAVIPVVGLGTKTSAKIVNATLKNSALTAEEIILKQSINSNTATNLLIEAETRFLTSEERLIIENSLNNEKAKNIFKNFYKSSDTITPGGTAGAIKYTAKTGDKVNNSDHIKKGEDFLRGIQNLLKNSNINSSDRDILQILAHQLLEALNEIK